MEKLDGLVLKTVSEKVFTPSRREVIIKGSYAALSEAIPKTKPGSCEGVPGFGIGWLPSTDSNRGPSG